MIVFHRNSFVMVVSGILFTLVQSRPVPGESIHESPPLVESIFNPEPIYQTSYQDTKIHYNLPRPIYENQPLFQEPNYQGEAPIQQSNYPELNQQHMPDQPVKVPSPNFEETTAVQDQSFSFVPDASPPLIPAESEFLRGSAASSGSHSSIDM
jgi:hypothetical protein